MVFYPQSRFTIRGRHRLHERLNNLLITNSALCIAAYYLLHGAAKFKPGEHMAWVCKQLDIEIKLPLHGPLEAALSNKMLDLIRLTCLPRERDPWPAPLFKSPAVTYGLTNVSANMVAPIFVEFYEAYCDWIFKRFHKPKNWPPVWRFAHVIRNSVSHGGLIDIDPRDDPSPWYGLTYSSADNGHRPMGGLNPDLGAGDILILIFEMNDALDELNCPI
jgi:hypothetical protein